MLLALATLVVAGLSSSNTEGQARGRQHRLRGQLGLPATRQVEQIPAFWRRMRWLVANRDPYTVGTVLAMLWDEGVEQFAELDSAEHAEDGVLGQVLAWYVDEAQRLTAAGELPVVSDRLAALFRSLPFLKLELVWASTDQAFNLRDSLPVAVKLERLDALMKRVIKDASIHAYHSPYSRAEEVGARGQFIRDAEMRSGEDWIPRVTAVERVRPRYDLREGLSFDLLDPRSDLAGIFMPLGTLVPTDIHDKLAFESVARVLGGPAPEGIIIGRPARNKTTVISQDGGAVSKGDVRWIDSFFRGPGNLDGYRSELGPVINRRGQGLPDLAEWTAPIESAKIDPDYDPVREQELYDLFMDVMEIFMRREQVGARAQTVGNVFPHLLELVRGGRIRNLGALTLDEAYEIAIRDQISLITESVAVEIGILPSWDEDLANSQERLVVTYEDGARIVEITGTEALKREGLRAGHCVGKEVHGHPEALREGRVRAFSYRAPPYVDEGGVLQPGKPKATLEVRNDPQGLFQTTAGGIQGPANGPIYDDDARQRLAPFMADLRGVPMRFPPEHNAFSHADINRLWPNMPTRGYKDEEWLFKLVVHEDQELDDDQEQLVDELQASFTNRVLELLWQNFPDSGADADTDAYLAVAGLLGHGVGLWEHREPWHADLESIVEADREMRRLMDELEGGL
jgi:hypothetical protein